MGISELDQIQLFLMKIDFGLIRMFESGYQSEMVDMRMGDNNPINIPQACSELGHLFFQGFQRCGSIPSSVYY